MSIRMLILSRCMAFLFVTVTAAFSEAQIQSTENPTKAGAIKDVAAQPLSNPGDVASVITPPSSPYGISVVATVQGASSGSVPGPIAKASSSSKPTSANAPFNKTVTIPSGITSVSIYCLNPPTTVGLATINLVPAPSGGDWPIYMDFNFVTVTSGMPQVTSWLNPGTYTGLTVYNHDTNNEWNPYCFYITWQ